MNLPVLSADEPGLLTKAELAAKLRVTSRTVESLQARGLPFLRVGPRRNRYLWPAVMAWLAKPSE